MLVVRVGWWVIRVVCFFVNKVSIFFIMVGFILVFNVVMFLCVDLDCFMVLFCYNSVVKCVYRVNFYGYGIVWFYL